MLMTTSRKKRILSWGPNAGRSGGRWRKYVNGKIHYFGQGSSSNDTKSYRKAERLYLEFMEQLEQSAPITVQSSRATVADICEKFLQSIEERYNRGEVTANYFDQTRGSLNTFAQFIGENTRFATLQEMQLEAYRSHLLSLPVSNVTKRPIRLRTAKSRLAAVKTLYRWAYKMYLIENMPRNLMDYTNYPWGKTTVKVYTLGEIETLWKRANDRLRCWIALALNCGFGQKDISDLCCNEIDWQGGYIVRERSKTGVKAKHKLWAITLQLLKQEMEPGASGTDRVFLTKPELNTEANNHKEKYPLLRKGLRSNGKYWMSDAIKSAFWRIQVATGINGGRGFYCFRKTGATLIEEIDPAATEMYLSHAEHGMKQPYAARNWGRLEKALLQLEQRLSTALKLSNVKEVINYAI